MGGNGQVLGHLDALLASLEAGLVQLGAAIDALSLDDPHVIVDPHVILRRITSVIESREEGISQIRSVCALLGASEGLPEPPHIPGEDVRLVA